ncbi:hypothetical protein [Paraliomyxa miuraensis]|uniref:hypothetical protein n=1 Tax=Paraliomyxa miuraensis TaxID=376150 RepID=UPI00225935A4|nr:hypothetical protein [Paraliomyxa miuraensis]MCX4245283.1 hypothetical protein [Paraliomyxa miuraensis]
MLLPAPRPCSAALGLCVVLGLGCTGDDASPMRDDAGDSTTGDQAPPRPLFSEPVSGMLLLPTSRSDDLVLKVHDVLPGKTELLVDGRTLGFLGAGASAGRLEAEQLTVRLRGAMVAGRHEMVMRTLDAVEITESSVIDVELLRDLEVIPAADPPSVTALSARHVLAQGTGDDALLVVLDDTEPSQPVVHLLPRTDEGWDLDGRRTVTVAGLDLDTEPRVLPVTALRHGRTASEPGRLRVAWRVGAPGTRIDVLDVAWDDASPEHPPGTSLSLPDAVAGAVTGSAPEWAELGRPWLLGELLVAELWAPVDVEAPRPGDHALLWTRVHDQPNAAPDDPPLSLDSPQRIFVLGSLVDLDRLGPALDRVTAEAGGPALVTIRADQHQPLVLEHDPAGGLRMRPTVVDGRDRSFTFVDLPLATVVGAFGSRTVAGLIAHANGRMRITGIDDIGDGGVDETSLGADDMPPLDLVTGEPATSSVGGLPVFLVPYGADEAVHAAYSTGSTGQVVALDSLRCASVALADRPNADGEVPLACVVEGELALGTLAPAAP